MGGMVLAPCPASGRDTAFLCKCLFVAAGFPVSRTIQGAKSSVPKMAGQPSSKIRTKIGPGTPSEVHCHGKAVDEFLPVRREGKREGADGHGGLGGSPYGPTWGTRGKITWNATPASELRFHECKA